MALSRKKKENILVGLTDQMKGAKSVVFADYQGLSVADINTLRSQLREQGVKLTISKKTLIKLAATEAGYKEIPDEAMEGPVGAAFCMEDEIIGAKILYTFSKKNKNLKLRGALFEGRVLSVAETKELALIPGREELLAKFIYLVKSPISGFHGVLNNTITGFVRALNAIKEKQEQGA